MERLFERVVPLLFTWYLGVLGDKSTSARAPTLSTIFSLIANVANGYKLSVCSKVLAKCQKELLSEVLVRDALLRIVESACRVVGARSTFIDESTTPPTILVGNILKTVHTMCADSMRTTNALLERVESALGSPEDIKAIMLGDKSETIRILSNTIKGPTLGIISGDYLVDYTTNPLLLLHRYMSDGTVRDFNVDYTTTMAVEKIVINAEYNMRNQCRISSIPGTQSLVMIKLDEHLRKIIHILYPIGEDGDDEYEERKRLNRIGMCRFPVIAVTEEVYNFEDKTVTFTWQLKFFNPDVPIMATGDFYHFSTVNTIFHEVNLILNDVENPPDTQRALNTLPSYSTVFAQIREDRDMMESLFPIIRLPMIQSVSEFRSKWENFRTAIRSAAVESGVIERTARMRYGVLSLRDYCPSNFLMI